MAYLTHSINESAVIYGEAGAAITAPAMKAVCFDSDGKFVLPSANAVFAGIVLATKTDAASGDRLDVQWKDICLALAGETLKRGELLKAHTDGTVKKATAGDEVIGIALGAGTSGKPVEIAIVRSLIPAS